MQAIKALYQQGQVHLLEPITNVDEAELLVIVLDKHAIAGSAVKTLIPLDSNSEQDFKALGLTHFFDTDEDQNIDWEDYFNVKAR